MEEAKRVLQVLGTTNLGGAESRIMDLYRHLDRTCIQFDFLVHTEKKGYFDDEIEALGGHIYHLPAYRVINHFSYRRACKHFFLLHHDYIAVHGHITSTASIYLPIAKKFKIPLTIAHARSAGVDKGPKGTITKWLRYFLYKKTDVMLSCSDLAAVAVYGQKRVDDNQVIVLPNAINTSDFSPNLEKRREIREKYNLTDKFVVGHVGRFHYAKNHEFLLEVFLEILKQKSNARLMLLGDGSLREMIEKKAESEGIKDKILFLGNQTPVAPFYQAMDVFIFPSRFEGMPGTVVEAQAAGLPCLISDTITREVKATDLVSFYSLNDEPLVWAKAAITKADCKKDSDVLLLRTSKYDVNSQVKKYEAFYLTGNSSILREG